MDGINWMVKLTTTDSNKRKIFLHMLFINIFDKTTLSFDPQTPIDETRVQR